MGKWTKTSAGLIFLAAASVYSDRQIAESVRSAAGVNASARPALISQAGTASPANRLSRPTLVASAADTMTKVKLLDDNSSSDPFAAPAPGAIAAPAAQQPATQPASEGKSISSQQVDVSVDGTTEIHVNGLSLNDFLTMLSLQSHINIIPSKDVHGTVTANLYDVTVPQALDAILTQYGYVYREKGNFIYVYTAKELADLQKAERHVQTQVFHLYYTPAANAATMIKPVLSSAGQVAVTTPPTVGLTGGSSSAGASSSGGTGDTGGDSHAIEDMLVVTDYPENLKAVAKVIKEIDVRPQQILLEATILQAELDENNALGIDFTVLGGVDFTGLTSAGATAADLLTGTITNNPTAQGIVQHNAAGAQTGFTQNVPSGGLQVGVVTSNVAAFLRALEATTDTTVLANPKVLTLNKQQGVVHVGTDFGYKTTITTETTTSEQVQTLQTGTTLLFRPFIADDGYIRMEVHPEDSDGNVNAQGLPTKTVTEVTSNIMVKDGHTIVIGGLFRDSASTGRSQIPFLGNLPLIGSLFRSQQDKTNRDEIIILLTPHIVKDQSAYSELSQEQLKHAEQMRVGVRKGMMPWGRNRLAESAYESARHELAKPQPDRHLAIWDLNEATNLDPTFTEAIELKQDLTGKVVTEASGSSIRDFVQEAILRDVPPAAPSTEPSSDAHALKPGQVAAAPATRPVAVGPATLPTADTATTQPLLTSAATEPSESSRALTETSSATTQPLAASEPEARTAEAPATQPAETVAGGATTQPSEQPIVVEIPATQPANDTTIVELPATQSSDESEAAKVPASQPVIVEIPATQPVTNGVAPETGTTGVTELPMDSATPNLNGGK